MNWQLGGFKNGDMEKVLGQHDQNQIDDGY